MTKQVLWIGVCVIGCCGAAGLAQEPKKAANPDMERARGLWEPQSMMQQACDGISAHYKLDARQKEFTCNLLTERVTKFLNKHETQFWPLLMELTEYQLRGEQPDSEAAKTLGRSGSPIFADARAEIMKAQDDFRQILNDEQKAVHDKDLKGLQRQLNSIEQRFQSWSKGEPGSLNPLGDVQIGTPGSGGTNLVRPLRPAVSNESQWERYVKQFIENYRLDETQKAAAMAIHKDLQERAVQYRKGHQQELEEADKLVRDALLAKPYDKAKHDKTKSLQQSLNKPFDDWFNELKTRLEQIPTEKQRSEYQERLNARRSATTKPATTRPAATQPSNRPAEEAKPGTTAPTPAPAPTPPATSPKESAKPAPGGSGGR